MKNFIETLFMADGSVSKTKITAFLGVLANVLLAAGVAEGGWLSENVDVVNTVIVMMIGLFLRDGMSSG